MKLVLMVSYAAETEIVRVDIANVNQAGQEKHVTNH